MSISPRRLAPVPRCALLRRRGISSNKRTTSRSSASSPAALVNVPVGFQGYGEVWCEEEGRLSGRGLLAISMQIRKLCFDFQPSSVSPVHLHYEVVIGQRHRGWRRSPADSPCSPQSLHYQDFIAIRTSLNG
uniref:Uncharacterized protein n=1 Tax=Physcomitrium patens TaxID=3218 RepID=A0A2K1K6B3_PHYPA|nr:hypothetical protein PHYPA_011212 [Physcomitrium patens]